MESIRTTRTSLAIITLSFIANAQATLEFEDVFGPCGPLEITTGPATVSINGVVIEGQEACRGVGMDFSAPGGVGNPFASDSLLIWTYSTGATIEFPGPVDHLRFEPGVVTNQVFFPTFELLADGQFVTTFTGHISTQNIVDVTLSPPASTFTLRYLGGSSSALNIDNLTYDSSLQIAENRSLDCNGTLLLDSFESDTWAGGNASFLSPAAWLNQIIPSASAVLVPAGADALCALSTDHSLCTLELGGFGPSERMLFELQDAQLVVEDVTIGDCSELYGSGSLASERAGKVDLLGGGRLRVLPNQILSMTQDLTISGILDLGANAALNCDGTLLNTGSVRLNEGSLLVAGNIVNQAVDGFHIPDAQGCWGLSPRAELELNGAMIHLGSGGQFLNEPPTPCESIFNDSNFSICTRVLCRSVNEIFGDIVNGAGGILTIDVGSTTVFNGEIVNRGRTFASNDSTLVATRVVNEGDVFISNGATLIATTIVDSGGGVVVAGECLAMQGCPPAPLGSGPNAATLIVEENLSLSSSGTFQVGQTNISLGGSFDVAVADAGLFQMAQATLSFTGSSQTQRMEALAQDSGAIINTSNSNQFLIGAVFIEAGAVVEIVDQHPNSGGNEVLYVSTLELAPFSVLDLAGNTLYYESLVLPGSALIVDSRGGGSVIEATTQFETFCFGDGSELDCPCSNTGLAGHGCNNSSETGGARLYGEGLASVSQDSVLLQAIDLPNGVPSLLFQGSTSITPLPFGDGLLCVTGQIKRLWIHAASGGTTQFPLGAEDPISLFGGIAPAGQTAFYQIWYRDQADFCSDKQFNTSNAIQVEWTP